MRNLKIGLVLTRLGCETAGTDPERPVMTEGQITGAPFHRDSDRALHLAMERERRVRRGQSGRRPDHPAGRRHRILSLFASSAIAGRGRAVPAVPEMVISVIAPGARVKGDCESPDTIRIDGLFEGSVRAKKAVVVGADGRVEGDIHTADARIAGTVRGTLEVGSRLELAASCVIDGDICAARMQIEEGGQVNGSVSVGRLNTRPDAEARFRRPIGA